MFINYITYFINQKGCHKNSPSSHHALEPAHSHGAAILKHELTSESQEFQTQAGSHLQLLIQ